MKIKKYLKNNMKKYIGYFLLTAFLFFSFYVGDFYLELSELQPFWMFVFWLVAVFISSEIIDYALGEYIS